MRRLSVCLLMLASTHVGATDLIFVNGKVWTGDPRTPTATAIAIDRGRIVAVGDDASIIQRATATTQRIDLKGRRVVPGINDAHTHITNGLPSTDLKIDRDGGSAAVKAALSAQSKTGGWLSADIGMDVLADADMRIKTLDSLQPTRPVFLTGWTGHGMLVNTAGQRALALDPEHVPSGGWLGLDASGKFDGRVYEYAQWSPRMRLPARPSVLRDIIKSGSKQHLKFGVTTIQNMAFGNTEADFVSAWKATRTPLRVRVIRTPMAIDPGMPSSGLALHALDPAHPEITVSGTKWILDGTPMERGAGVRIPYADGGHGRMNFTPIQIRALLQEAFDRKDQILLHISGDATLAVVLDAMASIADASAWQALRPRIEHGEGLTPDLFSRARDYGMILVQNPSHFMLPPDVAAYMQANDLQPLSDVLKAHIPLALGSDGPPNPWLNMMFAIAPTSRPDQALTREEVLRAYTYGSAFAEMREAEKGTLAIGYLADLAVLSQDVLDEHLPANALPATTSLMTVVNGVIAWQDPAF